MRGRKMCTNTMSTVVAAQVENNLTIACQLWGGAADSECKLKGLSTGMKQRVANHHWSCKHECFCVQDKGALCQVERGCQIGGEKEKCVYNAIHCDFSNIFVKFLFCWIKKTQMCCNAKAFIFCASSIFIVWPDGKARTETESEHGEF